MNLAKRRKTYRMMRPWLFITMMIGLFITFDGDSDMEPMGVILIVLGGIITTTLAERAHVNSEDYTE